MKHANWNWNDGTPEDGPWPIDPSELASLREFPEPEACEDLLLSFRDLIAKHDELAKMLQFPTKVQWLEEQPSEEEDDHGDWRIYAWDGAGNYHEISINRTDATTDACLIRFIRSSDDLVINVNWNQEA